MASTQGTRKTFNPLDANNEIRQFFSSYADKGQAVRVNFLGRGSFNAVYEVQITGCADGVIRLPLDENTKCPDEIILNEIRKHKSKWQRLRVPQPFPIDAKNFPWPCAFMDRIPGESLQNWWPRISHEHRISLAKQYGAIYRDFLNTRSPEAGIFTVNSRRGGSAFFLEPLGSLGATKTAGNIKILNTFTKHPEKLHLLRNYQDLLARTEKISTTFDCINTALDWRIFQGDLGYHGLHYDRQTFVTCKSILRCMEMVGTFAEIDKDPAPFVLWHKDLFPRNIMFSFEENMQPRISGVIDWDSAMFAPSFALAPPQWMWSKCYFNDRVSCCGCDLEIEKKPWDTCGPSTYANTQIKRAFYASAGDKWQNIADDPVFFMARKILDISMNHCLSYAGGDSPQVAARELLASWPEMLDSRMQTRSGKGAAIKTEPATPAQNMAGNWCNAEPAAPSMPIPGAWCNEEPDMMHKETTDSSQARAPTRGKLRATRGRHRQPMGHGRLCAPPGLDKSTQQHVHGHGY